MFFSNNTGAAEEYLCCFPPPLSFSSTIFYVPAKIHIEISDFVYFLKMIEIHFSTSLMLKLVKEVQNTLNFVKKNECPRHLGMKALSLPMLNKKKDWSSIFALFFCGAFVWGANLSFFLPTPGVGVSRGRVNRTPRARVTRAQGNELLSMGRLHIFPKVGRLTGALF